MLNASGFHIPVKELDSLMQNLDICTWEFREYFVESKYANVFL